MFFFIKSLLIYCPHAIVILLCGEMGRVIILLYDITHLQNIWHNVSGERIILYIRRNSWSHPRTPRSIVYSYLRYIAKAVTDDLRHHDAHVTSVRFFVVVVFSWVWYHQNEMTWITELFHRWPDLIKGNLNQLRVCWLKQVNTSPWNYKM